MKNVMVTGAAGFIGANFAEYFVNKHPDYNVIVVDKLTYAGNLANLDKVKDKITFVQADICDFEKMQEVFEKYQINGVIYIRTEHPQGKSEDAHVQCIVDIVKRYN